MGCDIHLYKEKFVGGKWVTADVGWSDQYNEGVLDVPYEGRFTDRNYNLFGLLAKGVRRELEHSFEARGMPLQCCPEVAALAEGWDADGHNHSYLYLHELRELADFVRTATMPISGMKNAEELAALRASIASDKPNWDLLYPYCQGTSDRTYVEFTVDVPMAFIVGDGLDRLITAFHGVNGENHRIVFWFDN